MFDDNFDLPEFTERSHAEFEFQRQVRRLRTKVTVILLVLAVLTALVIVRLTA